MNLLTFDNVIKDPKKYVADIHRYEFEDLFDGKNTFKGIQLRDDSDEFAQYALSLFKDHKVALNFVRKSPLNQEEPNFIHTDEMMGSITCVLYLNEEKPPADGTTMYDDNMQPIAVVYSKFNRMVSFNADAIHSRNILENFGKGENARLIQVIFLKEK